MNEWTDDWPTRPGRYRLKYRRRSEVEGSEREILVESDQNGSIRKLPDQDLCPPIDECDLHADWVVSHKPIKS